MLREAAIDLSLHKGVMVKGCARWQCAYLGWVINIYYSEAVVKSGSPFEVIEQRPREVPLRPENPSAGIDAGSQLPSAVLRSSGDTIHTVAGNSLHRAPYIARRRHACGFRTAVWHCNEMGHLETDAIHILSLCRGCNVSAVVLNPKAVSHRGRRVQLRLAWHVAATLSDNDERSPVPGATCPSR
jgi:hypothetical protein